MEASGRLSGPELSCPGGNAHRTDDRVVALAPGADGKLVTSERGVVEAVDNKAGALVLRTEDGRRVELSGEETAADRLGYGARQRSIGARARP
jgi:uncharacterized protein YbaP (TraB family)